MKPLLIYGGTIFTEKGSIKNGYLVMEDQQIKEVGEGVDALQLEAYEVLKLSESEIVVPGMIDLHIHGAAGADVMDGTMDALKTMAEILPQEGTTSFLATTMTQGVPEIESALQTVNTYMEGKESSRRSRGSWASSGRAVHLTEAGGGTASRPYQESGCEAVSGMAGAVGQPY